MRFTVAFAVPFDNNQAERDLRMVKLQEKISGCSPTLRVRRRLRLSVRSYIATARKHDANILRGAFAGDPWLPSATA